MVSSLLHRNARQKHLQEGRTDLVSEVLVRTCKEDMVEEFTVLGACDHVTSITERNKEHRLQPEAVNTPSLTLRGLSLSVGTHKGSTSSSKLSIYLSIRYSDIGACEGHCTLRS